MKTKRIGTALLAVALVGGVVAGSAEAAKKKKKPKPPVPTVMQVDQKMYLRGDACTVEARGLSLVDNADAECWYTNSGLLHDLRDGKPSPAGTDPNITWPALDGIPLTLDATKPITGEITTTGGHCPLNLPTGPGCLPMPVSAGNVTFVVKVVGEAGGEQKVIGEMTDEFAAGPGVVHTTKVSITPDAALDKTVFETLTLITRVRGNSVFHGVYKLDNPSSFISIPTLQPAA